MCGLCGIIGPGIINDDLRALNDLVFMSALRGRDGTGILQGSVSKGKKVPAYFVEKKAYPSYAFQSYHRYADGGNREVLNNVADNFFCVHTRAGTTGGYEDSDCHPFEVGENVVGMHNGTLRDKRFESRIKTDSELMFQEISHKGLKTTLDSMSPDSAFAIVLFNPMTGRFSFVRNKHRPLYFAIHKTRKVFYYASEQEMMESALIRNNISYSKTYEATENMIYTFAPWDVNVNDLPSYKTEKVVQKVVHNSNPMQNVQWFNNNVLTYNPRVTVPAPKITRESLHVKCTECERDMSLLDQLFGWQYEDVFWCAECMTSTKEDNDVKVN